MNVQEMSNYGKSFVDAMTDRENMKKIEKVMYRELRRELGFIGMLRLWWRMRNEIKRMKKRDWSKLIKRGLTDQDYLKFVIQSIALVKAMVDIVGMEKAVDMRHRIWDRTAYTVMTSIFPSVEELKTCEDFFACIREYIKTANDINKRTGVYEADIVEDNDRVFACNFKYCAYHEVAKEFGDAYLCYPASCYADEVFWSKVGAEVGWRYQRHGTLATGEQVCDFRLERIS